MIILQTINVSKSYGVDHILSDINIQIQSNDRVGLVGINGAGKSTLLKIIANKMLPDSGQVQIAKEASIGYLAQDSGLETDKTIWEEMLSVYASILKQEEQLRNLEAKMADPHIFNNEKEYERLMNEYSSLSEKFKENDGYAYEAKIRGVLHGLGFSDFNYTEQPVATLSGGQKTRLALAKLLLEAPELLILDEPTNYLDIGTLSWLEIYLKNYKGAIMIVSHDRYFLDSLVTVIYEIERTRATKYTGNYSNYIEEKGKQTELSLKRYEKQQQEISQLEDFIQKNIARASTTRRAQSRKKALDKMEKLDKPSLLQRNAFFSFQTDVESGNNVLVVNKLSMGFDDKLLFQNVNLDIQKGERVALVGPNGIGKSTLFKLVAKEHGLKPISGSIDYGSNVKIGYYRQEQENLNLGKTVIDEVWDDYPDLTETEIRTLLGNFLFIGDDVFKNVKDLSGGEKARVALAKLMLKKANFLLLDEPTNHLDTFSREVLENSLVDYPGTVLFISHDRYFLNRIATKTIELSIEGTTIYLGNYSYYLEKKEEQKEELASNSALIEDKKGSYEEERKKQSALRQLKRKISAIEERIEMLETEISNLEVELTQPEVFSNHELSLQKNEELVKKKDELEHEFEKWEEAQQELEY